MAHGMFKIKVVKTTNGEELLTYAAPTYPQKGETLIVDGSRMVINHISHVTKSGRDGGGVYHTLDHVLVEVCK